MEKILIHAVKTLAVLLTCALTALFPRAVEALAAADAPAFAAEPANEGMGRFTDGAPANDGGASPALQPSGRMTRLFSSVMEVGTGFPSTLCELIENSYSGGSSVRLSMSTGAGLEEILSDESRVVGTGLGYDLGPALRLQGFGIFDMDENSAYAGPALTYNLQDSVDLTTGVQVLLNEPVSERQDFYFAEIRVHF